MTNTNSLTANIISFLRLNRVFAWRNNTVGVYDAQKKVYRANPNTLKGVPDVIGFRLSDAKFVGVEVKTGKDILSIDQALFLEKVQLAGGVGMVVKTFDDLLERKSEILQSSDISEKKRLLQEIYLALQNGRIDKNTSLSVLERIFL